VRETLDPPLVAEIESRTAEVKGSLLDEVAEELDVETAAEAPTFVG
jgi:arsenite-transporting ATPase